jgi:membrane-associated phospholipid phosphatase
MLKKIFYNPFFLLMLPVWGIGLLLVLNGDKLKTHLAINAWHDGFSDYFFRTITHSGDGLFMAGIGVILLFTRIRSGLMVLLTLALSGLIAQLLKKQIFYEALRPGFFFKGMDGFHQVPGVELHLLHSFPSGHATTAFALFFLLALINQNKGLQIFFLIAALIAAFSRVYLSQHFLSDVLAGSAIGMFSASIIFLLMNKLSGKWELPLHHLFRARK